MVESFRYPPQPARLPTHAGADHFLRSARAELDGHCGWRKSAGDRTDGASEGGRAQLANLLEYS
jgi:hypothetical protein